MPKPTKGPRLGGSPAHERIILNNLASQLFEHRKITTTFTRAKRVQPLAEKLITKAKRGDLHARRLALKNVTDPSIVAILFEEIAPLELVTETVEESRAKKSKGKPAAKAKPASVVSEDVVAEKAEAAEEIVEEVVEDSADATDVKDYGENSYRGSEPPEGFDIKGNEDSMKYHTTESRWYDQTVAEVWFNSPEAAEAAGFVDVMADK